MEVVPNYEAQIILYIRYCFKKGNMNLQALKQMLSKIEGIKIMITMCLSVYICGDVCMEDLRVFTRLFFCVPVVVFEYMCSCACV